MQSGTPDNFMKEQIAAYAADTGSSDPCSFTCDPRAAGL